MTKVQASYTLSPLAFHPDLYFYGIHGVEALYAVMGTGCVAVSRKTEGNTDISTCKWKDGRVGVYYGLKSGEKRPMLQVWGDKGTTESSGPEGYDGLVKAIAEFFHTGRQPFDQAQTLEVFEFMTAAQLSRHLDGAEVPLAELRK